jgi:hypothetical protein
MQFYLASGSFLEGPYAEKTETNDGYAKIDPGFASNCKSKTKRREFRNSLLVGLSRGLEAQTKSEL